MHVRAKAQLWVHIEHTGDLDGRKQRAHAQLHHLHNQSLHVMVGDEDSTDHRCHVAVVRNRCREPNLETANSPITPNNRICASSRLDDQTLCCITLVVSDIHSSRQI